MAKCIPNVYGNADRYLINQIEAAREKLVVNGILPEYWQVGSTICTMLSNGFYHSFILEKEPYTKCVILREYRINRNGFMKSTNNFYRVPTKADFMAWCAERKVTFKEG